MKPSKRSLATILFTDIVGSTERAAGLRDEGWRDLRHEHDRRVRRELRRYGGHEINTAGDSFLATFESPARAIACADAIRTSVRELGLEIRAGLHMGEIQREGRDLGGLALNIGARVAAEAAPGEILVSRSVHDALAGSAFDFENRGIRALKGVPGEWRLFAVTTVPAIADGRPLGRWTPGVTRRRALLGGAFLGILILGMAALNFVRRDGPTLTQGEALAAADPGVAVVPFRVGDKELQEWREGMVDLLSTNLDGAGGLRAIDPRTVLARWREGAPEGADPDLATTLEIARRTGASYAVLGSAVTIGPELRLSAAVYDLGSDAALGEARVAGAPDSVAALVDRLSIEILRKIFTESGKDFSSANRLVSVTTTSLPALKAYLEGQALYRRGAYGEAVAAYERAVEADPNLALAYYAMAEACGMEIFHCPLKKNTDALTRALGLVDRLPEREAMLVRASNHLYVGSDPYRALELLHTAVQKYPDDPEAWYRLAEAYIHYGGPILAEEGGKWEELMERAAQLDPSSPSYMAHLVQDAFLDADSARAAEWTDRYDQLVTDDPLARAARIALPLAFGEASTRARAAAAIDSLDTLTLELTANLLTHPRFLPLAEELVRKAMSRPDAQPIDGVTLSWILLWQGKIRASRAQLDSPRITGGQRVDMLYWSQLVLGDSIVPFAPLEQALSRAAPDTMTWLFAGANAAHRARWDDHAAAIRRLREAARGATVAGDSVRGRIFGGAARGVEGYGERQSGRSKEAVPLLEDARRSVVSYDNPFAGAWNGAIRYWLGLVFLELDRPQEAAKYFESFWHQLGWRDPLSAYELARIRERLGRDAEAIQAYEYALLAWRNADPELRPRVEAARRAVTRLSGAQD